MVEQPTIYQRAPERSLSHFTAQGLLDTAIAIGISTALVIPVMIVIGIGFVVAVIGSFDKPPASVSVYHCAAMPKDDTALVSWMKAQPGVGEVRARRLGPDYVKVDCRWQQQPPVLPVPPWSRFGYRDITVAPPGSYPNDPSEAIRDLGLTPMFATILIVSALSAEGGLLVAVFFRRKRGWAVGEVIPGFFRGKTGQALLWGLGAGVVMVAIGQTYEALIRSALSSRMPIQDPFELMREAPAWAKATIAVDVVLIAPIVEEIFFRGVMFGSFQAAGYVNAGIVFSASIFGLMHLQPLNLPFLFAMGLLFAWLYNRTGSLASCITAHMVNNGVAMAILFFGHG